MSSHLLRGVQRTGGGEGLGNCEGGGGRRKKKPLGRSPADPIFPVILHPVLRFCSAFYCEAGEMCGKKLSFFLPPLNNRSIFCCLCSSYFPMLVSFDLIGKVPFFSFSASDMLVAASISLCSSLPKLSRRASKCYVTCFSMNYAPHLLVCHVITSDENLKACLFFPFSFMFFWLRTYSLVM